MTERRDTELTKDGSSTLYSARFDQHYHSIHGAVQESQYVFLDMGLKAIGGMEPIRILEMGFGTGLNAFMTCQQTNRAVHYVSLEAFPLSQEEVRDLNYGKLLEDAETFQRIHDASWEEIVSITDQFSLNKHHIALEDFPGTTDIDLVYWDAFAPGSQPELWTEEVFRRVYSWMSPGGILTTYSAKGDVRRALIAAGFHIEKLPGPPGKREMLRATR